MVYRKCALNSPAQEDVSFVNCAGFLLKFKKKTWHIASLLLSTSAMSFTRCFDSNRWTLFQMLEQVHKFDKVGLEAGLRCRETRRQRLFFLPTNRTFWFKWQKNSAIKLINLFSLFITQRVLEIVKQRINKQKNHSIKGKKGPSAYKKLKRYLN